MRHHKTIILLVLTAIMSQGFSQTETFDIATYKPPKDWKKETLKGVVTYTITNPATGGYCLIGVYVSKPSQGSAEKDFAGEWNDLAVIPYSVVSNPESAMQTTPDGWTAVSGTAPFTFNNVPGIVILTTFSGFGKTTSVVATLNDQTYIADIDLFLENLTLDKTETTTPVPVNQNGLSGIVKANAGSILGIWSDQNYTIGSYVNSSGNYTGDASISSVTQYEFKADNTFTYSFLGISSTMIVRSEGHGTYSMNGNDLMLKTTFYKSGYANDMKEDKAKETTETWQYYVGPNKWQAGPFLNLHKDGNYYMWDDYPYNYYNKIK